MELEREMTICRFVSGIFEGQIRIYDFDFKGDDDLVVLGKQTVVFDVPDHNPREMKLESLEKEKQKALNIVEAIKEKINAVKNA